MTASCPQVLSRRKNYCSCQQPHGNQVCSINLRWSRRHPPRRLSNPSTLADTRYSTDSTGLSYGRWKARCLHVSSRKMLSKWAIHSNNEPRCQCATPACDGACISLPTRHFRALHSVLLVISENSNTVAADEKTVTLRNLHCHLLPSSYRSRFYFSIPSDVRKAEEGHQITSERTCQITVGQQCCLTRGTSSFLSLFKICLHKAHVELKLPPTTLTVDDRFNHHEVRDQLIPT